MRRAGRPATTGRGSGTTGTPIPERTPATEGGPYRAPDKERSADEAIRAAAKLAIDSGDVARARQLLALLEPACLPQPIGIPAPPPAPLSDAERKARLEARARRDEILQFAHVEGFPPDVDLDSLYEDADG